MTQLKIDDRVKGTIETIAFGAEGIMRDKGFVIFIPFTAPGDVITCRIKEIKKSFAKADLIEIHEASPERTTPLCPYFGTCGGCQIQHLNELSQLKYKLNSVKDSLNRIGHLKTESILMTPTQLRWAYRRHVTLHLRPHGNSFMAGYIAQDHCSLVAIETCPIFNSKEDSIIRHLQELVRQIPNPMKEQGRVTILKNQTGRYILSFQFPQSFCLNKQLFERTLKDDSSFSGIIVHLGKQEFVWGEPYAEIDLEGLIFRFTPQSFIQNHPEQSANIYRHICSLTEHMPKSKIWDLYCGFGITSLLLSKQGHLVTGVECNPEAIAFAKNNAQLNGLSPAFIQGDVEKILPKLAKQGVPEVVLVNPPRTGMNRNILQILLKILPKKIIYVSCMPATLARDLSILCQDKYQMQDCMAYDMFPQTAHVETLVCLKKQPHWLGLR